MSFNGPAFDREGWAIPLHLLAAMVGLPQRRARDGDTCVAGEPERDLPACCPPVLRASCWGIIGLHVLGRQASFPSLCHASLPQLLKLVERNLRKSLSSRILNCRWLLPIIGT